MCATNNSLDASEQLGLLLLVLLGLVEHVVAAILELAALLLLVLVLHLEGDLVLLDLELVVLGAQQRQVEVRLSRRFRLQVLFSPLNIC